MFTAGYLTFKSGGSLEGRVVFVPQKRGGA